MSDEIELKMLGARFDAHVQTQEKINEKIAESIEKMSEGIGHMNVVQSEINSTNSVVEKAEVRLRKVEDAVSDLRVIATGNSDYKKRMNQIFTGIIIAVSGIIFTSVISYAKQSTEPERFAEAMKEVISEVINDKNKD